MKKISMILALMTTTNLYAIDNSSADLHLIGKVVSSMQTTIQENKNMALIEFQNNSEYSAEAQKFFVTNVDYKKVDLKTHLLANTNGKIKHEIMLKYVNDVNDSEKPIVFNIQTN
jgi:hypothetical protein